MAKNKQNAFMRPVRPSKELAAITGSEPLPRTEVVSKMWTYIKKNKLQNPRNKREILADEKLRPIFGKDRASMFEMNKGNYIFNFTGLPCYRIGDRPAQNQMGWFKSKRGFSAGLLQRSFLRSSTILAPRL